MATRIRDRFDALDRRDDDTPAASIDVAWCVAILVALAASAVAVRLPWVWFHRPGLSIFASDAGWDLDQAAVHRVLVHRPLLPALVLAYFGRPRAAALVALMATAPLLGIDLATIAFLPVGRFTRALPGTGLATSTVAALVVVVGSLQLLRTGPAAPAGRTARRALVGLVALIVVPGVALVAAGVLRDRPSTAERVDRADGGGGRFGNQVVVDGGAVFATSRATIVEVLGDAAVPVVELESAEVLGLRVDGDRWVVVGRDGTWVGRMEESGGGVRVWSPMDRYGVQAAATGQDGRTWVVEELADGRSAVHGLPADLGSVPTGEPGDLRSTMAPPSVLDDPEVQLVSGADGSVYAWAFLQVVELSGPGDGRSVAWSEDAGPCIVDAAEPLVEDDLDRVRGLAADQAGNLWAAVSRDGVAGMTLQLVTPDGEVGLVPDAEGTFGLGVEDGALVSTEYGDHKVLLPDVAAAAAEVDTTPIEPCP